MPVKRKVKSAAAKNKTSILKTLFTRYNNDQVTLSGVKQFFLALFYRIGYSAELTLILIWKNLKKGSYILFKYIKRIFKELRIFISRMFDTVFEDLAAPFARLKASIFNIKEIVKRAKGDASVQASTEVKAYIHQGMRKHKGLVRTLTAYTLPIFCFAVMFFVLRTGLTGGYAVQLTLNGQNIGYVDNYNVMRNADNVIKNKLVTLNDEQKWVIEPEVKIVMASGKSIIDERQLSDQILKVSDEDIITATGLYVDGNFYGAIENAANLNTALDTLLAPYQDENPDKTVTFLQDVSVVDGIFFTDTLVEEDSLVEMISGEVAGEQFYTVLAGDSPSLIASKNGLRLKELYALNPELEGGGLWVGDQLLVSQAVPFLQVKEVVREVREEEVAFQKEQKYNNSMTIGTTKVTQKGVKGINRVTADVTYIDGIRQDNEVIIDTEVISEPVTEVVEIGRLIPSGGVLETGGSGKFGWPTGGGVRVSRGFAGQYPAHNGLDIAGPAGTPIYAADSGVVTKAVYTYTGYGVHVIIDHGNGYQSLYAHCSSLSVSYGQRVTKGQLIGRMGSTGNSTGNHLHFEIKSGNTRYDPYRFL